MSNDTSSINVNNPINFLGPRTGRVLVQWAAKAAHGPTLLRLEIQPAQD